MEITDRLFHEKKAFERETFKERMQELLYLLLFY